MFNLWSICAKERIFPLCGIGLHLNLLLKMASFDVLQTGKLLLYFSDAIRDCPHPITRMYDPSFLCFAARSRDEELIKDELARYGDDAHSSLDILAYVARFLLGQAEASRAPRPCLRIILESIRPMPCILAR